MITLGKLAKRIAIRGPSALDVFTDQPVLVLRPYQAHEEVLAAEPVADSSRTATVRHDPWAGLADPESVVLPVVKSERNPFPGLICLGRSAQNDICLASSQVSRVQCWFRTDSDGNWSVVDKHSANGTWVNSVQLAPEERRPLTPGDQLQFGGVSVVFLDITGLRSLCSLSGVRP